MHRLHDHSCKSYRPTSRSTWLSLPVTACAHPSFSLHLSKFWCCKIYAFTGMKCVRVRRSDSPWRRYLPLEWRSTSTTPLLRHTCTWRVMCSCLECFSTAPLVARWTANWPFTQNNSFTLLGPWRWWWVGEILRKN